MVCLPIVSIFFKTPLLPGVTWLKFDASNMPAMVAGFAYGPAGGVAVGVVTAIIHGLLMADFTGALKNILVVTCFDLPAALINKKKRTKKIPILGFVFSDIAGVIGCPDYSGSYSFQPFERSFKFSNYPYCL